VSTSLTVLDAGKARTFRIGEVSIHVNGLHANSYAFESCLPRLPGPEMYAGTLANAYSLDGPRATDPYCGPVRNWGRFGAPRL